MQALPWVGYLLIVLGGGWFGWALWIYIQALQSRKWPSVLAQVTYNALDMQKAAVVGQRVPLGGDMVRYRYRVDGVDYEGTRLCFADRQIKASASREKWLARFPEGSLLQAYYDPSQPRDAVLINKPVIWHIAPFISALCFMASGWILWLKAGGW